MSLIPQTEIGWAGQYSDPIAWGGGTELKTDNGQRYGAVKKGSVEEAKRIL